jgi:hypothetical protein
MVGGTLNRRSFHPPSPRFQFGNKDNHSASDVLTPLHVQNRLDDVRCNGDLVSHRIDSIALINVRLTFR